MTLSRKSRLTLYLQLATCPCTHQKSPWRKMWNTFAEKTSFSRLISRLQRFFFFFRAQGFSYRVKMRHNRNNNKNNYALTTQFAYVLHWRKCKDVPISFRCVWWRTLLPTYIIFIGISKKEKYDKDMLYKYVLDTTRYYAKVQAVR